ncbi:unnamed protein product [Dibothriocephalus latus]|uniref:Uncharacterized protein n=1 Tax=Dibothriocephalus latus TaxID=60516 RepID=A0A3P7LDH3_DIBLA|nr:unnamed protein product [Dibothriocephalus latus]
MCGPLIFQLNSVALAPDFLNSPGHQFTTTTSADDASLATAEDVAAVSVDVALAAADPAIVREETKNKKLDEGDLAFGDEGEEEEGSGDLGEAFFNANDEFASENEASTSESSVAFEHPSSSLAGDRIDAEGAKTADVDPGDAESQDSETPFVTPRGGSHHPGLSDQSESEEADAEKEEEDRVVPTPQRAPPSRKVPVTFYDSMPTISLPPGHLPLYASWAIHTLGKPQLEDARFNRQCREDGPGSTILQSYTMSSSLDTPSHPSELSQITQRQLRIKNVRRITHLQEMHRIESTVSPTLDFSVAAIFSCLGMFNFHGLQTGRARIEVVVAVGVRADNEVCALHPILPFMTDRSAVRWLSFSLDFPVLDRSVCSLIEMTPSGACSHIDPLPS